MSTNLEHKLEENHQDSECGMDIDADGEVERPEAPVDIDTSEEDALDDSIKLLQSELNRLQSETGSLGREMQHLVEEKQALEANTMQLNEEMERIQQDLDFIRKQAPTEGEWMHEEQVVAEFKSLRMLVDQTITIVHGWFVTLEKTTLSSSAAKQAQRTCTLEGSDARQFIKMSVQQHGSLHTITVVLLRHYLSSLMTTFIFKPFLLEERNEAIDALQSTYIRIRDQEPQSLGGRWKAQTYRAAQHSRSRTESFLEKVSNYFVYDIASLYTWSIGEDLPRDLQDNAYQLALKVFNTAAEFKERVLMFYVNAHAIPYMVWSQERQSLPAQELYKGPLPSSDRLLGLDLGLGLCTVTNESGRPKSRLRIRVPASFIGDNSALVAHVGGFQSFIGRIVPSL